MNSSRSFSYGFTLIEIIVVVTIIGILLVGSYVPYDYYSRISKVRISVEKIRQGMEDAKILAQNGQIFPSTTNNANIGLVIHKGTNVIDMFAYLPGNRNFHEDTHSKILKTIRLEDGVNINTLPESQLIIEYKAPHGEIEIYTSPTATGSNFQLGIGWKTSIQGALYRIIEIKK